jgi:hypothetical protein
MFPFWITIAWIQCYAWTNHWMPNRTPSWGSNIMPVNKTCEGTQIFHQIGGKHGRLPLTHLNCFFILWIFAPTFCSHSPAPPTSIAAFSNLVGRVLKALCVSTYTNMGLRPLLCTSSSCRCNTRPKTPCDSHSICTCNVVCKGLHTVTRKSWLSMCSTCVLWHYFAEGLGCCLPLAD